MCGRSFKPPRKHLHTILRHSQRSHYLDHLPNVARAPPPTHSQRGISGTGGMVFFSSRLFVSKYSVEWKGRPVSPHRGRPGLNVFSSNVIVWPLKSSISRNGPKQLVSRGRVRGGKQCTGVVVYCFTFLTCLNFLVFLDRWCNMAQQWMNGCTCDLIEYRAGATDRVEW